jgi:acyl carrier protein
MIHINEVLDVINMEMGSTNIKLEDRWEEDLGLDHSDIRDILYYLEQEFGLRMDNLWYEDDLIKLYPTVNDLIEAYEEDYDSIRRN